MLDKFSVRNGYIDNFDNHNVDQSVRNRIWNLFYQEDIMKKGTKRIKSSFKSEGLIEDFLLDKAGLLVNAPGGKTNRLKEYLFTCEWFEVLDFVESHVSALKEEEKNSRVKLYNDLFEYEGLRFRLVSGKISPIYSTTEMQIIEQAVNTEFETVNQHMNKALSYFSDRKQQSPGPALQCVLLQSSATEEFQAYCHLKQVLFLTDG